MILQWFKLFNLRERKLHWTLCLRESLGVYYIYPTCAKILESYTQQNVSVALKYAQLTRMKKSRKLLRISVQAEMLRHISIKTGVELSIKYPHENAELQKHLEATLS